MDSNLTEWLHLVARWVHVFAGILWVGQTFLFTWMDRQLSLSPQLWMVHSGGFYLVEKRTVAEPGKLRWFRWEALITFLSGLSLLILVYYAGGLMLDDTVSSISLAQAVLLGLGLLVAGYLAYDLLWLSPLGKNELVGASLSYALLVALAFGLLHLLSARAAYLHVGSLMGTIMAVNVWARILPAQRVLVAQLAAGKLPDAKLAARAKLRSKHNTFLVVPLVFLMLSNHFPTATYGNDHAGLILALLVLAGWGTAKLIREH